MHNGNSKAVSSAERHEMIKLLIIYMYNDVNNNFTLHVPARFDWSIIGCTIRRRALINLQTTQTNE